MKKVLVLLMVAALATVSQAAVVDSFVNADFETGGVSGGDLGFHGFDLPWSNEIDGWTNYPADAGIGDAGVEGPAAWWGTYDGNSAFILSPGAATNMSSYVIQADDVFSVEFMAKDSASPWWESSQGEWTVSLYYNDPTNVIGSYATGIIASSEWIPYASGSIAATGASIGGTLGILFESTGPNFACLDNVTVHVIPEPATMLLLSLGGLLLRRKK